MRQFKVICEECNNICEAVYLNGVVKCTKCGKELNEEEYIYHQLGGAVVAQKNPLFIMDKKAQIACVNCFENLPILDILNMMGEATEDTVLAAATLKQIMNYMVLNIKRATINEKPLKINMEIREE